MTARPRIRPRAREPPRLHVAGRQREPVLFRLAEFSRLILFDKRGTGLSDRDVGSATLEDRIEDVRTVMEATGSKKAALLGYSEGGPMSNRSDVMLLVIDPSLVPVEIRLENTEGGMTYFLISTASSLWRPSGRNP